MQGIFQEYHVLCLLGPSKSSVSRYSLVGALPYWERHGSRYSLVGALPYWERHGSQGRFERVLPGS